MDGGNNQASGAGTAASPLLRRSTLLASYQDGLSTPFSGWISAREISRTVADAVHSCNTEGLSDIMTFWGQFLTHDITQTEADTAERWPILFPLPTPSSTRWQLARSSSTSTAQKLLRAQASDVS